MKVSSKQQSSSKSKRLFVRLFAVLLVGAIGSYIAIISFGHADIPTEHNQPFGMDGLQSPGSATQTEQINDYSTLGVQWARMGINWAQIQPTAGGAYNWTKLDTEFQQLAAHGIKTLGVIHDTPDWAKASDCGAGNNDCHPANPAQYATFAGAVAAHFAPLGGHAWEIMNEINSVNGWGTIPSPSEYTALIKAAYTAIKASDGSATVVTGGSAIANEPGSIKPTAFLSQMYAAGAKGFFDAVGEHPYCKAVPGTNAVAATCVDAPTPLDGWYQIDGPNNLHDVMVSNGDGNKLVWITEFGAIIPTDATSEALQVSIMTAAYAKQKELSWLGPLFWYEYKDGQFTDGGPRQNDFGLVALDGSHKPAFATYTALAHSQPSTPPPSGSPTPTPLPTPTPSPTSKSTPSNSKSSTTTSTDGTTSPTSSQPTTTSDQTSQSQTEITPTTLIEHPSRAVHSWTGKAITLIVLILLGVLAWRLGLLKKLRNIRFEW